MHAVVESVKLKSHHAGIVTSFLSPCAESISTTERSEFFENFPTLPLHVGVYCARQTAASVKAITADFRRLEDAFLSALAESPAAPHLETISVGSVSFSSQTASLWSKFVSLRVFNAAWMPYAPREHLAALAQLPHLEELKLEEYTNTPFISVLDFFLAPDAAPSLRIFSSSSDEVALEDEILPDLIKKIELRSNRERFVDIGLRNAVRSISKENFRRLQQLCPNLTGWPSLNFTPEAPVVPTESSKHVNYAKNFLTEADADEIEAALRPEDLAALTSLTTTYIPSLKGDYSILERMVTLDLEFENSWRLSALPTSGALTILSISIASWSHTDSGTPKEQFAALFSVISTQARQLTGLSLRLPNVEVKPQQIVDLLSALAGLQKFELFVAPGRPTGRIRDESLTMDLPLCHSKLSLIDIDIFGLKLVPIWLPNLLKVFTSRSFPSHLNSLKSTIFPSLRSISISEPALQKLPVPQDLEKIVGGADRRRIQGLSIQSTVQPSEMPFIQSFRFLVNLQLEDDMRASSEDLGKLLQALPLLDLVYLSTSYPMTNYEWLRHSTLTNISLEVANYEPQTKAKFGINDSKLPNLRQFRLKAHCIDLTVSGCSLLNHFSIDKGRRVSVNLRECPTLFFLKFQECTLEKITMADLPRLVRVECNSADLGSVELSFFSCVGDERLSLGIQDCEPSGAQFCQDFYNLRAQLAHTARGSSFAIE